MKTSPNYSKPFMNFSSEFSDYTSVTDQSQLLLPITDFVQQLVGKFQS
jgi:hypothetical protein